VFGYGSDAINGQLVGMRTSDAYSPRTYGPVVNVGTAAVSAVPPSLGAGGGTINGGYTAEGDSLASGAANVAHAQAAGRMPFDMAISPLPWAIIFLVVGLVGLRVIHWR
jgi:hypothetical protein